MEPPERAEVVIEAGHTLAGTTSYNVIDAETGDDACGFFHSRKEAEDYIKEKGWKLVE